MRQLVNKQTKMYLNSVLFFPNRFVRTGRVKKQLVAILCLTLLGCLYVQHSFFRTNSLVPIERGGVAQNGAKCQPKSNIVFLKAHKCASSTIQNIFMRYGYLHQRNFVLPPKGNYLGHPKLFHSSFVPSPASFNGTYNILTHHARLNYPEMRRLMPLDTIFVTILRNPVGLFESMFHYYSMNRFWHIDFEAFNDRHQEIPEKVKYKRYGKKFGTNQMMFDLGFEVGNDTTVKAIENYIQYLDAIFSLVMISERMDESLVLLKHLLCWTDEDVVVFKVNARNDAAKHNITEAGYERLRKLNFADKLLYDHFAQKFAHQVEQFGVQRMKTEIERLQKKTKYFYDYCVDQTFVNRGYPVVGFLNQKENDIMCNFLTNSELRITKFIRQQQLQRAPGSVYTPDE